MNPYEASTAYVLALFDEDDARQKEALKIMSDYKPATSGEAIQWREFCGKMVKLFEKYSH